jgi:hypothetical protein
MSQRHDEKTLHASKLGTPMRPSSSKLPRAEVILPRDDVIVTMHPTPVMLISTVGVDE